MPPAPLKFAGRLSRIEGLPDYLYAKAVNHREHTPLVQAAKAHATQTGSRTTQKDAWPELALEERVQGKVLCPLGRQLIKHQILI